MTDHSQDVSGDPQPLAVLQGTDPPVTNEAGYRALLAAAQRQAQELALLHQVRTALLRELDLPLLFQAVVGAVAETFGYTHVSLYLLRDSILLLQHQVGGDQVLDRIPVQRGLMGRVAASGQAVLLEDVASAADAFQAIAGATSAVCVPLCDQDRVVGVLNVESAAGFRLGPADLRLMTALAEHIGLAMDRARLYTEARAAAARLHQRNEELAALQEMTLGLINQFDPGSLLEAILTRAGLLADTPHGFLYVVEPGGNGLVNRFGTGVFAAEVGYRVEADAGLAGRVWQSGTLLAVEDYSTWDGRQTDRGPLNLHATCGIPLRAGTAVLGVIGLAYLEPGRTFGPEEIALLARFAELASLALANAQLYAAVQQQSVERRRAEQRLAHVSWYDPLTGLPNRLLFHDRLQQAILGVRRGNPALALLVMDLDRFKEINDTLGHHLGDLVLRQVGERMQTALRVSDTVARLGGDEFGVLLRGAEARAAGRMARKLAKSLEQPFEIEGHSLDVRVSIGIALCPEHGDDAETLLRRGDVAMYLAKRGGGGYALYSADQDPYNPGRLALIGDLRKAIGQDQLVLYYQPKISPRTGRPTGVEALVRWPHPERGFLRPDQFIPLAEHTGLIRPLSHWVLATALKQCRVWADSGLQLPVAVNLSMRDLHDPHLPETVGHLLDGMGVPPALLRVEITEGTAMADLGRTLSVLSRLRALGVCLAIDDFGTGHSSLAHLKRLPVDQIKIDKAFVHEMLLNDNDAVIVRSTINLGHMMGLIVVAEGVEDEATWDCLAAWGCDEIQGYYISHPLCAADLSRWLEQPARAPRERTAR